MTLDSYSLLKILFMGYSTIGPLIYPLMIVSATHASAFSLYN